jgi:hypothetical protein
MGVFMAEVYMYIYNWQEKKEENQALEDFCHAPGDVPGGWGGPKGRAKRIANRRRPVKSCRAKR